MKCLPTNILIQFVMELTKMKHIVLMGTIAALSGFNCFLLDDQNTTKIDQSMTGHTTLPPPTKVNLNTTDKTTTDQNNIDSGVIIKVWSSTSYYFHYYHIVRPTTPLTPTPPPPHTHTHTHTKNKYLVCPFVCLSVINQRKIYNTETTWIFYIFFLNR